MTTHYLILSVLFGLTALTIVNGIRRQSADILLIAMAFFGIFLGYGLCLVVSEVMQ